MAEISIHNSAKELAQSPEAISRLNIGTFEFDGGNRTLPYAQKITCPEKSGAPVMIMFLHGAGSVGHDNFLQLRIPAKPLIEYCESRNIKAVILFPQCEKGFQWVDVPWNSEVHLLQENPSVYMKMALDLLKTKTEEFKPSKQYGLGISMGGYGIWDMACRREKPFDGLGVMCGGADTLQAHRFKNTRIYMIHGAKDTAVPVCRARNMAGALKVSHCNALYYKELPEAEHNVWDDFFATGEALDFVIS